MDRESYNIGKKKFLILSRYIIRSFAKKMMNWLAMVLFVLSIGISLFAMLPSLRERLRQSSFLSGGSSGRKIAGTVFEEVSEENGKVAIKPLPGVIIEAGGFRAISNVNGTFELGFYSQVTEDIPIILRLGPREMLNRISFPTDQMIIQKDFTFK